MLLGQRMFGWIAIMETRQLLEKLDKCSQQQQTEIMQWKSQITVVLIPSACTPIVTVSLEDLDALGDVTVYPNPVDNIVNVELGSLESASVRLLDVNGKVLFLNENVNNSVYTFEMNQEPGVYFVEVSTNNNVKRFKVVKN